MGHGNSIKLSWIQPRLTPAKHVDTSDSRELGTNLLTRVSQMGVTIEYYTKSEVDLDEVRAIVAATKEPNGQPWILCEPIHFFDMPGFEKQLFGASKLNLLPDPDEKAEADANYHPEKNDLEFLLDKLAEISQRFNVDWMIQIEGSPIGSIDDGVCDDTVREAVKAMADVAEELGSLGDLDDFM